MAHAVGWAAFLRLDLLLRVCQRQNLKNGRPLSNEVVQSLLLILGKRMPLVQQHWLAVLSLCPRKQDTMHPCREDLPHSLYMVQAVYHVKGDT